VVAHFYGGKVDQFFSVANKGPAWAPDLARANQTEGWVLRQAGRVVGLFVACQVARDRLLRQSVERKLSVPAALIDHVPPNGEVLGLLEKGEGCILA
jgi:hypothetical protein